MKAPRTVLSSTRSARSVSTAPIDVLGHPAYATNDDSREKRAVGEASARASAGRALFLMAERLAAGLTVAEQLRRAVG